MPATASPVHRNGKAVNLIWLRLVIASARVVLEIRGIGPSDVHTGAIENIE